MCDEFYDDDGGENFASDPDNQYDIMRDDSVCELSQRPR